jgi:hypothetical protein
MKLLATALATCVCLAGAVAAQAAEGRQAVVVGRTSTSAQSFCTDLQKEISSQRFRFSGWRCKPGPDIRGNETILAWVTMTHLNDKARLILLWLAKTEPVVDAPVIDLVNVPRYGYEPSNVLQAFRVADTFSA